MQETVKSREARSAVIEHRPGPAYDIKQITRPPEAPMNDEVITSVALSRLTRDHIGGATS